VRIEHIAIWSKDIERLKNFYIKHFNAVCNSKYTNDKKGFQSYFLSFKNGARIEIMQVPDLIESNDNNIRYVGLAHFAVSVGNKEAVDLITNRIRYDGYTVLSEPRTTGDGYYESVVMDTDGNHLEITI